MHSPLPDSSALEAGILEDVQPSRLSRVQDNVRNLLRTSTFGSVASSPATPRTPIHQPVNTLNGLPTPPASPTHQRTPPVASFRSPLAETTSSSTPSPTTPHPTTTSPDSADTTLHPAVGYRATLLRQMAHASALFNTRAVAALDHPDLSDPSMAVYVSHQRESRRRGAWTRSSRKGGRRGRGEQSTLEVGSSQCLLCVLAALLLSAIVATYVVLATTSNDITPTFHILFILGIILALIVFIHTVVRLFLVSRQSRSTVVMIRHRHHRRREHHRPPRITAPPPNVSTTSAYIPATPIQVHMPSDAEVRPDSREAEPTATIPAAEWDKDVETLPNPPPAYGRWRGSVRVNPDLLHWRVLPSPAESDETEVPSPTYEEAMAAQRTGPPSYVTRDSPERRAARAETENAQAHAVEVEMVEGAGIGLGL